MAGKVRSLSVVFQAFTDKFEAATDRAANKVTGFGKKVLGAVAGFVAARATLSEFTQQFEKLDRLGKLSDRLQVDPEFLRGLDLAATQTGTSFEAVQTSIQRMARTIGEARSGIATGTTALKDLGLEAKDFDGQTVEDQFLSIAEKIANIEDPTQKAAAAFKVFGRQGQEMLNLLNQGEPGIRKFVEEAEKLGGSISREELKQIEAMNDAIDRMSRAFEGIIGQLAIGFAPLLEDIAAGMTEILSVGESISKAWKETRLGIGAAYIELQRFMGTLTDEQADDALTALTRDILGSGDGGPRKGFGAGGAGKGIVDLPGIAQRNLSIKTFSEAATAQSSRAFDLLNPNQNVQQQQLTENKKTNTKLDQIKRELKNNGSGLARQDIPS